MHFRKILYFQDCFRFYRKIFLIVCVVIAVMLYLYVQHSVSLVSVIALGVANSAPLLKSLYYRSQGESEQQELNKLVLSCLDGKE